MSERTLTKIGALLRKAECTDNEHEAAAYFEAAQRLASAASIDLAVARAHGSGREHRNVLAQREIVIGEQGKKGLRTYIELFVAIAQANDVRCDVARNSTRVFAYGYTVDLDTVQALYSSLIVQMVRASDQFISSRDYAAERVHRWSRDRHRWELKPVSAITARLSFQRAYAARVGQRLERARRVATAQAQAAHAEANGAATSVALAIRDKKEEVKDHYQAHSTARGSWRGSAATAGYSEHASRAGDRAGRRARVGTETAVGGSRVQISR